MKFTVGNLWVDVDSDKESDHEALALILRVFRPSAKHDPRYNAGVWDGYVYLYDYENRRFFRGLLGLVTDLLREDYGITPEYGTWKNPKQSVVQIPPDFFGWGHHNLRDYQIEAIEKAIECGGGIIELPTGSGKTTIIAGLCKSYTGRVVVVVNTALLLTQTAGELSYLLGEAVGLVGDSKYTLERVTVATVQTLNLLASDDPIFDDVEVMILDETHHAGSDSFQNIIHLANAEHRFGLSGTPFRSRELSQPEDVILLGVVGEVIYMQTSQYMIEKGILALPEIVMFDPKCPPSSDYSTWARVYSASVVKNLIRNTKIVDLAVELVGSGRSPLVLVSQVAHASTLYDLMKDANLKVVVVKGGGKAKDYRGRVLANKDALDKYSAGGYDVIIGTTILDEGIDVPSIDALIVAGGGKSYWKTVQRLGRVLRAKKGRKNIVPVVDVYDSHHNWLKSQSKERLKTYRELGHEVDVLPYEALLKKVASYGIDEQGIGVEDAK